MDKFSLVSRHCLNRATTRNLDNPLPRKLILSETQQNYSRSMTSTFQRRWSNIMMALDYLGKIGSVKTLKKTIIRWKSLAYFSYE